VVEAQQREDGGVEVVNVDFVSTEAGRIRRSRHRRCHANATAREDGGEGFAVVVAARIVVAVAVADGFAAKFAAPDDEVLSKRLRCLDRR